MSLANNRFDLHVVENFLDAATCRRLIEEIRSAEAGSAVTYGRTDSGTVDERVRKVMRAEVNAQTVDQVTSRLYDHLPRLRDYFDVPLNTIEEPQFLWYGPGDYFVAHQDGNTKMIQLESDRLRRTSLTVFLNPQSDDGLEGSYSGGSLVFIDRITGERCDVRGEAGKLVAFRSEMTHEVTPVESGNRFAIVTWCRIMAS